MLSILAEIWLEITSAATFFSSSGTLFFHQKSEGHADRNVRDNRRGVFVIDTGGKGGYAYAAHKTETGGVTTVDSEKNEPFPLAHISPQDPAYHHSGTKTHETRAIRYAEQGHGLYGAFRDPHLQ